MISNKYQTILPRLLVASFIAFCVLGWSPKKWSYDPGPDRDSKMGQELIEINASIPNFPSLSYALMNEQKFRPAFGPIVWRMLLKPNSIKILFIGQDGTHIAEAAGRPATAGFGGRAHDLAQYFGVKYSLGFINTYAFTIKGQYGDRGVPLLYNDGQQEAVCFSGDPCGPYYLGTYMDNELWLMSQDQRSPLVHWRNRLIDWIIRNNKESLRMIVTFGGSARDSISSYIISRGGEVGTRFPESALAMIQVPEYKLQSAGGNNNFPVPIDVDQNDLYWRLFADRFAGVDCEGRVKDGPNYTPPYKDRGCPDDMAAVKSLLQENLSEAKKHLILSGGGSHGSGLLHAAQLGGFDIQKITIEGRRQISLKGLKLGDGDVVKHDVLVVDLPHPTYLSMNKSKASQLVAQNLAVIEPYFKKGWQIDADVGYRGTQYNEKPAAYFAGKPYRYGRGDIGNEFYDFGTPENRMVSESHAKRLGQHTILLGARADNYFDMYRDPSSGAAQDINRLKNVEPNTFPNPHEDFTGISRTPEERNNFDSGPGENYAQLLKENLNLKDIFANKAGMTWGRYEYQDGERFFIPIDGIRASDVKSHESVGDFGHYRGTFKNPQVFVLADPQGYDDLITARALTGTRGQYLQGLMNDLGVPEQFLILKTVPFAMDGATADEWQRVLEKTKSYRKNILDKLFAENEIGLVLTDGQNAASEIKKWLDENPDLHSIQVVNIERSPNLDNSGSDMLKAGAALQAIPQFSQQTFYGKMANIPGRHLSYYARVWEGTSGDRVVTSPWDQQGVAFIEVVPRWVTEQRVGLTAGEQASVMSLRHLLCSKGLPLPGEEPLQFMQRKFKEDFPSCL